MVKNKVNNKRWQTIIPIEISSIEFGVFKGIGVNISNKGIFIHTYDPLPLGTEIMISIGDEEGFQISGIVRSHYYMTYKSHNSPGSFTGMGIYFTGVENATMELEQMSNIHFH
jgi:hypothetical protein